MLDGQVRQATADKLYLAFAMADGEDSLADHDEDGVVSEALCDCDWSGDIEACRAAREPLWSVLQIERPAASAGPKTTQPKAGQEDAGIGYADYIRGLQG